MTIARSNTRHRTLNQTLAWTALLSAIILAGLPTVASAHHRDGHRHVVVASASVHHRDRHHRQGRHRHRDRDYRYDDRYDNPYDNRHHGRHGHRRVERARRYASQATAQAHTAWRLGCGRSGPRWSTNWDDHFYWALDERPRKLRRELNRRDDRIQECRARHSHHRRHRDRHYRPY